MSYFSTSVLQNRYIRDTHDKNLLRERARRKRSKRSNFVISQIRAHDTRIRMASFSPRGRVFAANDGILLFGFCMHICARSRTQLGGKRSEREKEPRLHTARPFLPVPPPFFPFSLFISRRSEFPSALNDSSALGKIRDRSI